MRTYFIVEKSIDIVFGVFIYRFDASLVCMVRRVLE